MLRGFRIAVVVAALVAVVSISTFLYLTRGISAPSTAVATSVQQIEAAASTSQVVYRIAPAESQASYSLAEVLNGVDTTVVGSTDQVAGDILIDLSDPGQSALSEIAVNARTFATDDERRDNSVARFVLRSEADGNEYVTFQTTSISGLPASISLGDTVTFQVTGDLSIAGTTREVTFDLTATLVSADDLVGHAGAVIQRSAFNLSIPSVAFVADVGDDVTLQLDFVAHTVTDTVA